ncbi:MAG: 3-dehydroquinate synthase [Acidimicrobiales bacterium]|jgi:5-deoxy-5-amino-3-dehydroquinate synthase
MRVVSVTTSQGSYEVVIGPGASRLLGEVVPPTASRVAIVSQAGIPAVVDPGVEHRVFFVPPGESAKTLASVEALCRDFARMGLARNDAVVALGGGVVSDLAGFAASAYHRGIAYVNVPTTLLAQVDAAVGGKTGVNLPEGKNLVGAFWQPHAVLCDTDLLASLPEREWASGHGEMAKYAFLGSRSAGTDILALSLAEQVARCIEVKAAVVSADEREAGQRMVLNYGHTLGHAIEATALSSGHGQSISHGEAVAVGIMFAALLARRLGRIDDERVEVHRKVLAGFELPSRLPPDVERGRLVEFMSRDKKADHDLTFVLDGPAGVEPVRRVPEADVMATLAEMEHGPEMGMGH